MSVVRLPGEFTALLERLLPDASRYFACRVSRLVPTAYHDRPVSYVARIAVWVEGADAPHGHLFAKVFKLKPLQGDVDAMRRRVEREFHTTSRVHAALLNDPECGAVPPMAWYPDLLAIVTEEVAGPTLLQYLSHEATWLPGRATVTDSHLVMSTVGRWIRALQSVEPPGAPADRGSFADYINVRLTRLVEHPNAAFSSARRDGVLRHIESLVSSVRDDELTQVLIHADLSLGNVLVAGRRIVVLDFAMSRMGTTLHDLTRVHLQVGLLALKPWARRQRLRTLQEALLHGYDPALTTNHPLFRLLTLLHRVNNLTSLYLRPQGLKVYNRLVRRNHERWIADELARQDAGR